MSVNLTNKQTLLLFIKLHVQHCHEHNCELCSVLKEAFVRPEKASVAAAGQQ